MNSLDLFEAIGELDPAIITEAEEHVFKRSRFSTGIRRTAIVAAVLLALFIPARPLVYFFLTGGAGTSGDTAANEADVADMTGAAPSEPFKPGASDENYENAREDTSDETSDETSDDTSELED